MNELTFAEKYEVMCKELLALEREAKRLDRERKEAKAKILEAMEKYGVKAFENDILKLTYVDETVTTGLDTRAFQMGDPDVYEDALEKYPKETRRSAYIKITPR